jgi:hypothetical protein
MFTGSVKGKAALPGFHVAAPQKSTGIVRA